MHERACPAMNPPVRALLHREIEDFSGLKPFAQGLESQFVRAVLHREIEDFSGLKPFAQGLESQFMRALLHRELKHSK